jgi:hypothetical protein
MSELKHDADPAFAVNIRKQPFFGRIYFFNDEPLEGDVFPDFTDELRKLSVNGKA